MNERIKELWTQTVRNYGHAGQENCAQQFAELIVKECAKVCEEIAGVAETTNTGEMARKTRATAISCSIFIKNRFGVK